MHKTHGRLTPPSRVTAVKSACADDSRNINRAQKPYGTHAHARLDSRKIIYANLSYGDRKNIHVLFLNIDGHRTWGRFKS